MVKDIIIGVIGFVGGCAMTAVFFGDIKAEISRLRGDLSVMFTAAANTASIKVPSAPVQPVTK